MKNRYCSLMIVVCIICCLTMTSCSAAEIPAVNSGANAETAVLISETQDGFYFNDVPADAWYAEAVNYCQRHGIMNGTAPTAFAPEDSLTRAMLAEVLYRMSGSPAAADAPTFTDAAAGAWYSNAVSWAAESNVISGYGSGTFGVNDPTTREQAVTILWRYAGSPESSAAASFSDASSISEWAKAAARWANASGILDGMTENSRFDPQINIKRGEVASMLYRYLNLDQQPTADSIPRRTVPPGQKSMFLSMVIPIPQRWRTTLLRMHLPNC